LIKEPILTVGKKKGKQWHGKGKGGVYCCKGNTSPGMPVSREKRTVKILGGESCHKQFGKGGKRPTVPIQGTGGYLEVVNRVGGEGKLSLGKET